MPCFYPLTAYRSLVVNSTGKRSLVFKEPYRGAPSIQVGCGKCLYCRLKYSRNWAVRCVHESSLHEDNSFITLTYDDSHISASKSLELSDFQDFMKRLRKWSCEHIWSAKLGKYLKRNKFSFKKKSGIRFFHCGEYGEKFKRPHYHAIVFGLRFEDAVPFGKGNLQRSETLEKLWTFGYSSIGPVNLETCAYVARYIFKKFSGEGAEEHYTVMDSQGNFSKRNPEYVTMSRRPGIGAGWFKKYTSDVFPCDEVLIGGKKLTVPRFYSSMYEVSFPSDFEGVKRKRVKSILDNAFDNTPARLKEKETCLKSKLSLNKRGYEDV